MPTHSPVALASALRDAIAAQAWCTDAWDAAEWGQEPCTAERVWLTLKTLKELHGEAPLFSVLIYGLSGTREDRVSFADRCQLSIALRWKADTDAKRDAICDLAQTVKEWLQSTAFTLPGALLEHIELLLWDDESLTRGNIWIGVFTLRFRWL